jgi:hypothetical protein
MYVPGSPQRLHFVWYCVEGDDTAANLVLCTSCMLLMAGHDLAAASGS